MRQRTDHPTRLARSRLLAAVAAVAALVLLLAWRQPWRGAVTAPRPAPVRPTATPRPAPTATGVPERIAPPTALPRPEARATATGVVARPPLATPPTAGLAGAGSLLYLGTVNGRGGIVAVNADGGDRRLLVPGVYDALAWSPDGARFAATGPIDGGPGHQVAIFAPDGRALARYPFERRVRCPASWSPDGYFLLCYALPADGAPEGLRFETWVIDAGKFAPGGGIWPVAAPPGGNVFPYGWAPDGRIAFLATDGPGLGRPSILWTTDLEGQSPLKLYQGTAYPIGWSPTGAALYALDYAAGGDRLAALTQLVAIDLPRGAVRPIAGADELATAALGVPAGTGRYRFDFAAVAPDGARFALGLVRGDTGAVAPAIGGSGALLIVRPSGLIEGVAPTAVAGLGPWSWSPDGSRLALLLNGAAGETQLRIVDATAAPLVTYPLGTPPPADSVAGWSPDGRWLAFGTERGLVVTAAEGTPRSFPLAPDGAAPTWRPAYRP